MSETVDCQVFQDQLEGFVAGNLPPEAVAHLRAHAAGCAECALQFEMHSHLAGLSLEELEKTVPREHLVSMWPAVQGAISERARSRPDPVQRKRSVGWLLPGLAAASLALLFVSGYLLAELRRTRAAVDVMADRLEAVSTPPISSQAIALPSDRRPLLDGQNPWLGALSGQDQISVGGLRKLLVDLPGNPMLLDSNQLRTLRRVHPALAPVVFRDVLSEMRDMDALRARDLLRILNDSDLDPNLSVPTARLIELLS